jgi:hypothetical protein
MMTLGLIHLTVGKISLSKKTKPFSDVITIAARRRRLLASAVWLTPKTKVPVHRVWTPRLLITTVAMVGAKHPLTSTVCCETG